MKFDSVILDIDGTIWNTTSIVADAWNVAIKNSGMKVGMVSEQILQREFGKTMNVIASDLWPELSQDERDKLMAECCKKEQVALNDLHEDITYPGVVDTIGKMAEKVPVFIVSNCQDGYIQLVIKKNGLEKFIKDFECYGRTGHDKSFNIAEVVKRNDLKNPVYVGDTDGDAMSCKSINVPFIWASYGFGKTDAYAMKIKSFDEILNLL